MKGVVTAFLVAIVIAIAPTRGATQSQYEFKASPPRPVPSPASTLELAPAHGPKLPPAPPPLGHVEIPSPFIGCWQGDPDRFDSIVNTDGGFTIGEPGQIVFCYRNDHIDVPIAKLVLARSDWLKDIFEHMGLGIVLPKVDEARIRTEIYAVTPTQIHARTFVPLKGVDLMLWIIPLPFHQELTDEELVTLKDRDTVLVTARQELDLAHMRSLRTWHADFHRVPDSAITE